MKIKRWFLKYFFTFVRIKKLDSLNYTLYS